MMATLRERAPREAPADRLSQLEVELRFEPTHFLWWDFGETHPRDDPAWQAALEEYARLVCTRDEAAACDECRRVTAGRFPDEWLSFRDADGARGRRDATLVAAGSRAQAVAAMHPPRCACRRHRLPGSPTATASHLPAKEQPL